MSSVPDFSVSSALTVSCFSSRPFEVAEDAVIVEA